MTIVSVSELEGIESFVSARVSAFSTAEMSAPDYHWASLIENLDQLSPGDRVQSGSDQVRASVIRAKERIMAHSAKEGEL